MKEVSTHLETNGAKESARGLAEFFDRFQPAWSFRYAVVAAVVFIALYGVLWLAGRAILSETYQLVSVTDYEQVLAGGIRGEGSAASREFSAGMWLIKPSGTMIRFGALR